MEQRMPRRWPPRAPMAASAASTANGAATPDAALASALRCLLRIADADQARRAHRNQSLVQLVEDGEVPFANTHLGADLREPAAQLPRLAPPSVPGVTQVGRRTWREKRCRHRV